jgi:hypothetical protein
MRKETLMSAPSTRPATTGSHGKNEIEADADRGRRWQHVRPHPRRRTDFMGFNSALWMALGWVLVILLVVFPFPWVW